MMKLPASMITGIFAALAILSGCGDNGGAQLPAIVDQPLPLQGGGQFDPVAAAGAQKGGEYRTWGGPFPKSLNSWLDNWSTSAEINALLFHQLADMHSVEDRPVPDLASSWRAEADGRSFIFEIDPAAVWSDGKPVTAEDVQFYYDTIMNPKNLTVVARSIVDRFERPEILSERSVRIRARERYWKAFWDAASFVAFPKHVWEGQDFNSINFEFPVVNGPYRLREVRRNRYALLERRADWWARNRRYNQNKFNFDYIRYRFMEDRNAALEAFKKGDYDLYAVYTASIWVQQTDFDQIRNNWVVRQTVYNRMPLGFQGIAINMRREKFQDVRVRRALTLLLNRAQLNEKLMFDQYVLLNSYFPDLYPGNVNPAAPSATYDPELARRLLDEAGWRVGPGGIRTREGQALSVSFLTDSADQRHLNVFVEDLKRAGIQASIEQLSKAEVTKRTDAFQFDLYWINTGSGRLKDPEPLFLSTFAHQEASYNLPGVEDAQVDRFLEDLRGEENLGRRNEILKRLDQRLLELQPYILLWQSDRDRVLYWNRFGMPANPFGKYARENAAIVYWWFDRDRAAALDRAQQSNQALPSLPSEIHYNGP
ncbi:MAG: extracellular solute-binding protein [Leptospirales bacterium]|nr:extracellular solute-binding protein [Leptospirales bacterium]